MRRSREMKTMVTMTYEMWEDIPNFSPGEFNTTNMSQILIYTLQDMRDYTGRKINIHSGFRPGSTGYHPLKMASDLDIEGLHVIDMYLIAERFDALNGIGVYPNWNNPGIHVDVRPRKERKAFDARWGCFVSGEYVKLDYEFFKKVVEE